MFEPYNVTTLGEIIDRGIIEATTGFPYGGHNSIDIGVPHIRPFNVQTNGAVNLHQIKSIPFEAAKGKARLEKKDIVFNNTNTKELVGKCALWNEDISPVFSNHMTRIRVLDSSYDSGFLSFAILHHWTIGKSEMLARSHVAQASIMGERFREIEIPKLGVSEQRLIFTILSQIRLACQAQELQTELALKLKGATMRELFTRGLRGEAQKETEIGLVPESWETKTLSAICDFLPGFAFKSKDYVTSGIRLFKITNVSFGITSWDDASYLPSHYLEQNIKFSLSVDDIVLAMTRPIVQGGIKVARISATDLPALLNQRVCKVTPKNIDNGYLYHLMFSKLFIEGIQDGAGGSQQPNISAAKIGLIKVPVSQDKHEQKEIAEILDAIDQKIDLHKRKKTVLEELFKSLLHKLMTGEIRVADLDLSALQNTTITVKEAS